MYKRVFRQVWKKIEHYITPTKENTYRPHFLQKPWLVFFLVLSLMLEGFLVSSMMARQTDSFLTRRPQTEQAAAVVSVQSVQTVVKEVVRILGDPKVVNVLLGVTGVLVFLVVVFAFFMHIEVQSHEAVAGGLVVVVIAGLLVAANMHFLGSTADVAAGIRALAP